MHPSTPSACWRAERARGLGEADIDDDGDRDDGEAAAVVLDRALRLLLVAIAFVRFGLPLLSRAMCGKCWSLKYGSAYGDGGISSRRPPSCPLGDALVPTAWL